MFPRAFYLGTASLGGAFGYCISLTTHPDPAVAYQCDIDLFLEGDGIKFIKDCLAKTFTNPITFGFLTFFFEWSMSLMARNNS